jgi:hypothetical protein
MNEDWSDAELEVCVKQYWKAVAQKGTEREIDRKAIVRGALRDGLKARGEGSVQRRMCNLSAVLEAHEKPWVLGWPPLRNVGSGVTPRIEGLMQKYKLL